ncbi:MAG: DNA repair protein RadC [Lentisphaerota bacterium]
MMEKNGSDVEQGAAATDHSVYEISPYRMRDLPARERPREMFDRLGAEHLSETVLLALILRSGVSGVSVIELGQQLLRKYGSLAELSRATLDELAAIRGMGKVKAQVLKAALELGRRLVDEQMPARRTVRQPEDAASVLRETARALDREIFWVLLLDTKHGLKKPPVEVSKGLLDASLVHPREVFREAICSSSAAVVLMHNHPSGDPNPSSEDLRITRQLIEAGRVVDIPVLDHVILGRAREGRSQDYCSLREAGLVDFSQGVIR